MSIRRFISAYRHLCALALALLIASGCGRRVETGNPEQLLEQGWKSFRLADYRQALEAFDDTLRQPGVSVEHRLKALHGKASVWDLRQPVPSQDDALARQLYQQVLDEAPGSEIAPWCKLALARMIHLVPVGSDPDYEQVRKAYQEVVDAYPDHIAAHEALIYQQSTLLMTLEPADASNAIARLQAFAGQHPDSPFASSAYNLIAQGCETLGDNDGLLDARLKELETLEVDPANPAAADLSWRYWQLASTAEFNAGRFDIARIYYRKLIDEYPLDFRKFPAMQALARMDRFEQDLREGDQP